MATAPRQRPEERRLLEWCRLQGVVLDGVKLDGRRLVATRDLAVGHCAISVPKAAVLSTDQAMASDIGQRILAQPGLLVVQDLERQRRLWLAGARHLDLAQGAVTRRSVLYAFLIHLRGSGGSWGAYADALPKSYGSPFTWATRELGAVYRQIRRHRGRWWLVRGEMERLEREHRCGSRRGCGRLGCSAAIRGGTGGVSGKGEGENVWHVQHGTSTGLCKKGRG